MKSIHIFSRATPLNDVKGRVKYATSPDKQEHLLAVAGETDSAFWERLAMESQLAWRQAGGNKERECCEAREIFGTLPNSAEAEDLQALAQEMADDFTATYGAPCLVAIHKNKKESSLHYHRLVCDRDLLAVPEIRAADRNVFLDENGVRKRTKKEILDADGQIREGCRIVPKGEILSERHFGARDEVFASKEWLDDYNHHMANWINERLQPDKKRIVYDPNGPYLPQQRIPKGAPEEKEARIQKYNRAVQKYNSWVEQGIIEPERASAIKGVVMAAPDRYEALEAALFPQNVRTTVPGGERTKHDPTDPVEQKRQHLRALYRESNLAWAEYRKLPDGSLEKKLALGKARGISAQIDALKRELGLYTSKEYKKLLDREEEEMRKKREYAMRCRSRAHYYAARWNSCNRHIDYLRDELRQLPVLFATEEERARRREIWAEIEEAEADQRRYAHEEWMAKQKYKAAKKEAREMRKKACETRQELRKQKKKENAQGHGSDR